MATTADLIARSLQRLVVVVVSLALGLIITSQYTYASCGDYLDHGSMSGSDHRAAAAKFADLDQSLWQQVLDQARSQRGPTRCERGQCRQAPAPLPIEPSRVAPVRDQSFVCHQLDASDDQLTSHWPVQSAALHRQIHFLRFSHRLQSTPNSIASLAFVLGNSSQSFELMPLGHVRLLSDSSVS